MPYSIDGVREAISRPASVSKELILFCLDLLSRHLDVKLTCETSFAASGAPAHSDDQCQTEKKKKNERVTIEDLALWTDLSTSRDRKLDWNFGETLSSRLLSKGVDSDIDSSCKFSSATLVDFCSRQAS